MTNDSNQQRWTGWHTVGLLIIIVIPLLGLMIPNNINNINRLHVWLVILASLVLFAVIAGHGVTGRWLGLLIDERNKMSLSRLQMILWTVILLSGFLTAALSNIAIGAKDPLSLTISPLSITIPKELWLLMGISTTSLVGSPLILSGKKVKKPEENEQKDNIRLVAAKEGVNPEKVESKLANKGHLVANADFEYAHISDLFKGEEIGNFAQLDLAKVQMFYFTMVLVLSYAVVLGGTLTGTKEVTALPPLSSSMVMLLGISHAGYLTNKAVPHSQSPIQ